ncbi:hypothetical protein ABPG74_022852 [Tetrahymena malaccensis]
MSDKQQQPKKGLLKLKGNKTASDIVNNLKNQQELLKKRPIQEALPKEYLQHKKKEEEEKKKKQQIEKLSSQPVTSEIKKTKSQEAFDVIRKKRFDEKVQQELKITHREKLEKFNKGLSQLPEHFDIPKVGPG